MCTSQAAQPDLSGSELMPFGVINMLAGWFWASIVMYFAPDLRPIAMLFFGFLAAESLFVFGLSWLARRKPGWFRKDEEIGNLEPTAQMMMWIAFFQGAGGLITTIFV